ncbi:MAG: hypothetical protein QHJ81_01830 [Anaerolineae bacterium]|nr:hypothetical protein [Anaerolineae bacterium]
MRWWKRTLSWVLAPAALLVVIILAVHFWPAATPPDAVVAACLQALQSGDMAAAQRWWAARLPGGDETLAALRQAEQRTRIEELATLARGAVTQVGPATYWSHCCEPVQLANGHDAFAARVEVRLERGDNVYQMTFYLGDAAHDGQAWAWGMPWTRWWQRPRGRQQWRVTSVLGL